MAKRKKKENLNFHLALGSEGGKFMSISCSSSSVFARHFSSDFKLMKMQESLRLGHDVDKPAESEMRVFIEFPSVFCFFN